MHYLGVLREEIGDLQSAEYLQSNALLGRVRTLGVAHVESLQSVNRLGNLLEKMGNHAALEKVFSDYLRKVDAELGETHELALQNVNYLAHLKNKHGKIVQALSLLRKRAAFSPSALDAVRYNLACYECLDGNTEKAKRLVMEHLSLHPEMKPQALNDGDFSAIKDYIASL